MTPQDTTGSGQGPGSLPDFDGIFAKRIRESRLETGMTQQQLADRMAAAGIRLHRSAIAKIEAGDRPVSIGEAVQIARVLRIPLMELVHDRRGETYQEKVHHARVEAQIAVRALEHEAEERQKLLNEAEVLANDTQARLATAQKRLRDLGGGVAWDAVLDPGKDDQ